MGAKMGKQEKWEVVEEKNQRDKNRENREKTATKRIF